jgi:PAS domain S-box-containing protein
MNYAAPINVLTTLLFAGALTCAFRSRTPLFDRTSKVFLCLSLGVYLLVGVFNVLEHSGVTGYLDRYEDYLEIVFITFFLVFIYSVHVNVDLRRRERAEASLRESEAQYRTLVEAVPYGIQECDREGRITFANSAHARTHEYSAEEIVEKTIFDLTSTEEERQDLRAYIEELIREQPAPVPYFGKDRTKSGRILDVRVDWDYRRDGQGNITGFVSLISDITERRRAEEGLKLFRHLMNRSNDSIFVIDPASGKFLDVNHKACSDLGYTREDLLGRGVVDVDEGVADDLAWEDHARQVRKRGSVMLVSEHRKRDGTLMPVEINVTCIGVGEREYMLAIVRDVTERRKMEAEMVKAQKLESLGVLAGGLAHDFNNLLTAILGNVSVAALHAGEDEKIIERLKEAEKATLRARDLTQQLITFSKGGEPIKKTVAVGKIMKEAASFALSGSNVRCEFRIPDDVWPVEADEGQMGQALGNLLINAVQAMPKGGAVTFACDNVRAGDSPNLPPGEGEFVRIVVQDEGVGIPREHLASIFDPYFSTKETGSGLGLSTVYSIVKKHEGEIFVHSTPGEGTTFTVYLPASDNRSLEEAAAGLLPVRGEGRILIMDDEAQVRDVGVAILSRLGYTVDAAGEGNRAVEMYREALESGNPYAAVILDLTIPGGMGGEETVAKLAEMDPAVKAIVSSGYSDDPIMADCREWGFAGVALKPYTVTELSSALSAVLSQRSFHSRFKG